MPRRAAGRERLAIRRRRGPAWRATCLRSCRDRRRRHEAALALVPRRRITGDDRQRVLGRARNEAVRAHFPEMAGIWVETREPDPTVSNEPFDCGVVLYDAEYALARRLDD